MTTINCSSNCIHQKDGSCTLENATAVTSFIDSRCIYYEEKLPSERSIQARKTHPL